RAEQQLLRRHRGLRSRFEKCFRETEQPRQQLDIGVIESDDLNASGKRNNPASSSTSASSSRMICVFSIWDCRAGDTKNLNHRALNSTSPGWDTGKPRTPKTSIIVRSIQRHRVGIPASTQHCA
ncbi:hypothetical protein, partial [Mycolicibacterium pyrenivorans]|uniref:hypothetical protein n=1 Tax=Mycolicibacterium pyrenivorans TaxID=187102 RepID=UPI0021F265D8